MQQTHFGNSYALNKYVFSLFLNVSSDTSGAHSLVGRLLTPEVLSGKAAIAVVRSSTWNSQSTAVCRSKLPNVDISSHRGAMHAVPH